MWLSVCKAIYRISAVTVLVLASSITAFADESIPGTSEVSRLLIVYDSSNSMWGELDNKTRKFEAGREALKGFLDTDFGSREIALRAYGHRRKTDCRDSELVVPFSSAAIAKQKISNAADKIRPTGKTPITHSLREAVKDFDGQGGEILLISDGIETCDTDPCDLMREWKNSDVNIRVHVVGVGLTEFERQAMTCIAETSGGKYFDAESAEGFKKALAEAGSAIEEPTIIDSRQAGEGKSTETDLSYAIIIKGADETGRMFRVSDTHAKGEVDLGIITSTGRYGVDGPGEYVVEVGTLLQDGTAYKPVKTLVTVSEPGDTIVDVLVTRPAIVSANFVENGAEHRGSNVTAYQDGEKLFGFRAFDEVLARPGEYEFRTEPNADNKLFLTETLVEGKHTELVFDLTKTIGFYIEFVLPNGETFRRASELWRDDERVYKVYGSVNPTTIIPGVYELRAEDQNLPLTPVEVELTEDGKTYQVPIEAGWVKISYAPSEFDYVRNKQPTNAFLESLDRGNSKYSRVNTPIPVKPGRYKANPRTEYGFMDSIVIDIANNETTEVMFEPKPLGEIMVRYESSDKWGKTPDRAFVSPLDAQPMLSGFLRPDVAKKFLPGLYSVRGGGADANAVVQEVTVSAHERTIVILQPN